MPKPGPDPSHKYSVIVTSHGKPKLWTWEIQRVPPLPSKNPRADQSFISEKAAKLAGEKALHLFLQLQSH
jgi:hypothetical protein